MPIVYSAIAVRGGITLQHPSLASPSSLPSLASLASLSSSSSTSYGGDASYLPVVHLLLARMPPHDHKKSYVHKEYVRYFNLIILTYLEIYICVYMRILYFIN